MRLGNPRLAVDTKLEEEGKWVECPDLWWKDREHPMRILVRGATTNKYRSLARKLTRDLSREELEERAHELSAELSISLIVNWENFFDTEGSQILFSIETCREILFDPDNRRLLDHINKVAASLATFDVSEEVEKN